MKRAMEPNLIPWARVTFGLISIILFPWQ